jgi:hypothetical protein
MILKKQHISSQREKYLSMVKYAGNKPAPGKAWQSFPGCVIRFAILGEAGPVGDRTLTFVTERVRWGEESEE